MTRLEVKDSSYFGLLSIFGRENRDFSVKGLFGGKNCIVRVLHSVS